MKPIGLTALLIATAATTIADVRTADACSQTCGPGAFVPADGATVPANLPALSWSPTYTNGSPNLTAVTLTREDGGPTVIPFTATLQPDGYFVLVPSEPLVAGATYKLVDTTSDCYAGSSPPATFTVGPEAPLPTRLGTLTATPEAQTRASLATPLGTCSIEVEIEPVGITLTYAAEAAPWRDVLHLETLVDGDPWHARSSLPLRPAPGASWTGRGTDRIYAVCTPADSSNVASHNLPEGDHEVSMRASLPGTSIDLLSDVVPASLRCADSSGHGGGCAASRAETTVWLGLALAALLVRRRRAAAGLSKN